MSAAPADPTDVLDGPQAGERVVRGGAVRAVGYVASTLLALIGVAFVTRHLGVAEYGRFQTVISLITIVGTITDAGMGALGMREYAQLQGEGRALFMRRLLGLRLALTVVGAVAAVVIATILGYPDRLLLGAAAAGVGLVLTVVATTLSIPLAVALRNEALTGLDLLRQTLTVAGYIVLVAAGAGVAAFLAMPVPVGLAVVAVTAVLARRQIGLRPAWAPRAWAGMLRGAAAFTLATAVGTIYIYLSQILTAAVADERQAGLFAASFRVTVVVVAIPGLLATVAFPLLSRAARDDHVRLGYALGRLFDASSLLGIGAALGLILGAPVLIDVMAGEQYAPAADVLRIQAAAVAMSFVLAAWSFALLSLHRHTSLLVVNLVALAVSAISVGLLAAAEGARGAAVGSVLGELTLAVGSLLALVRGHPDLRPAGRIALRGLLAGAPWLLLLLVPGLPSLAATVIGLAGYAAVLVLLRAVPDEILGLLPARLRR
jgi:O-antigen/teichoic acid export membrane protein